MGAQLRFDHISEDDFESLLVQYPETVPPKLADLEDQRLSVIPARLRGRKAEDRAHLTKVEVATLVDWKLSHGTFRPSLKGLVQQNSEDFVKETTTIGFSEPSLSDSLNVITKLKGIGPATAALLLSTSDPEKLPFFSDELFRWAFWEDKAGARWDRKIKYSLKEYRELVARVDELRKRIGRTALEAEKVAYVLGKQGVSLSGAEEATKASKAAEPTKESTQAKRKAAVVRDTEQKADENPPAKSQKSQAFLGPRRVTRSSKRRE